ncbi:MAG: hypothetical protein KKB59_19655 [Spirochaetes bacterium]|nr:hypothetical protein [Spirochaetota bacterium]
MLGQYDIVHFHRRINDPNKTVEWIKKFQEAGAIVIADIDDYWIPFKGHPVYSLVMKNKVHLQILSGLKASDYVTTTTEIYAKHIREKANENVQVIPNAVDHRLPMWQNTDLGSEYVRVGWIGGSSHERDLDKLKGMSNKLFTDKEVRDKIQFVMCGYDTRGTMTEVNPVTKEERTRPITAEESIWNKFEDIFNDYGRIPKGQYVRRNTLPITKYGQHYNHVDICLAPLDEHTFNECKSELKIIETGMMEKALIASDLYVYHDLLEHGVTGMLVDPKKNHKLWYRYIRDLVLDDAMRNEMSAALHKLVYPRYTLETVTKERCEWYKKILGR